MFIHKLYHGIKKNGSFCIVRTFEDDSWLTLRTYVGTVSHRECCAIRDMLQKQYSEELRVVDLRDGRFS